MLQFRSLPISIVVAWTLLYSMPLVGKGSGADLAAGTAGADVVAEDALVVPTWPLETPVPTPSAEAVARAQSAARQQVQVWSVGPYHSIQANVDSLGNDILLDAANEPSIAIDPTNPQRIVIAWRQFDTIFDPNAFRQAGIAFSHDGGLTWTATTLDPGQFRSDPVLAADSSGNFFFSSLSSTSSAEVFKSVDGGVTWLPPVSAFGGDKQWMTVDRSGGIGDGFIYQTWNTQFSCCPPNDFTRSTNGGASFPTTYQIPTPSLKWGTLDVGPSGELYVAGSNLNQTGHVVAKSTNVNNGVVPPAWVFVKSINLGGSTVFGSVPNPGGMLGQVWIATDHSTGPTRGNVYILGSVKPAGVDPLDVMFIRSTNGGSTFTVPIRVNDDPSGASAYQWFGTMSVAPNGRIDVIYYDTQVDPTTTVRYTASFDAGTTWSASIPVSPPFNRSLGYPNQTKIGDYCQMISDNLGASLAYAATFNGGEDVYFLRIDRDCNGNMIDDATDIANATSADCNHNQIPDECDIANGTSADCNANQVPDSCDIASGAAQDCNANGVPDICDIASGSSLDVNHNLIPDECECTLNPVAQESNAIAKNRYIGFTPGNPGLITALRVTIVSIPPPFAAFNGTRTWVAAPQDILESSNPDTFFKHAGLTCAPVYLDWGSLGTIQVSDDEIVPGAVYEVQAVKQTCSPGVEGNFTTPLQVSTSARWGDVADPFNPPSPTAQPDMSDVSAVVDKFKNALGAVSKARADLYPDVPDQIVDFADVSMTVDAFKGQTYPFDGPSGCP